MKCLTQRLPACALALLSVTFCLPASFHAALAESTPAVAEDNAQTPDQTNEHFRNIYAQAKKDILAKIGPVIIASGDSLILLNAGKRESAVIIPPLYTLMKVIDHVPLAIFVLLNPLTDQKLPPETINSLSYFGKAAADMEKQLESSGFSPQQLRLQYHILDRSIAFTEHIAADGKVTKQELLSFTRKLRAPIESNIYDSVGLELAAINLQVMKWKHQMSPQQWSRLHAVIIGGHMPRQHESRMQYFSRLLEQGQEGDKIIYMEGSGDEQQALDLLATHILDRSIGEEFFGNPWHMHRDLLSEGAKRYLMEHPPGH